MKRFSGYNLPKELVEQILVNLPVKSLLRFKSVCNSWNSLINDPKFIHNHLQVNIKKSNRSLSPSSSSDIILGWACKKPSSDLNTDSYAVEYKVLSLAINGDDKISLCSEIVECVTVPDITANHSEWYNIHGSHCNGLLCLVNFLPGDDGYQVLFYNPALREHRSLIVPTTLTSRVCGAHGFGYDPKTHDYKFVRILWPDLDGPYKVEVYTLGTDCWREVEPPNVLSMSLENGGYLKGRYYWIDFKAKNLLSFDMSEESFGRVALPSCDPMIDGLDRSMIRARLMVHNESLVFVVYTGPHVMPPLSNISIWVTKTMDGRDWTKQQTVMPEWGMSSPIIILKDNEVLISDQNVRLVLYNISIGKVTKILSTDTMGRLRSYVVSSYVESLISVK